MNVNGWKSEAVTWSCNCVGPQGGQPLCPCKMRGVVIKEGRYIMPSRDLAPIVGDDK